MSEFKVKGKLTENPEMKVVKDNIKVMNIALTVDKKGKQKDGEKTSYYESYPLWEGMAEKLNEENLKKGDSIELSGIMIPRRFDVVSDGKTNSKNVYVPRVEKIKVLEKVQEVENEEVELKNNSSEKEM